MKNGIGRVQGSGASGKLAEHIPAFTERKTTSGSRLPGVIFIILWHENSSFSHGHHMPSQIVIARTGDKALFVEESRLKGDIQEFTV